MTRWRALAVFFVLNLALFLPVSTLFAQQSMQDVLSSVVRLRAEVPADARTAPALGQIREGNGVVIDDQGLVLTIGYLILEAESVSLFDDSGREVDAEILAYDYDSGFGLVRAVRPLGVTHVALGDSGSLSERDRVLVVGHGGRSGTIGAVVVSRREFAGYWEYLLDNAIFTSPPHPNWGGAALIDANGELVGIGSLIVGDAIETNGRLPGNMFVPINVLKPVFADLLEFGRSSEPQRPWLGLFSAEAYERVIVTNTTAGGPAERAGIVEGDVVLEVNGATIPSMSALFREVWKLGSAGVEVPMKLLRGTEVVDVVVVSGDRYDYLRLGQPTR